MSFQNWVYLFVSIYIASYFLLKWQYEYMIKTSKKVADFIAQHPIGAYSIHVLPYFPVVNTLLALFQGFKILASLLKRKIKNKL